jgi:hypothetical protein
MHGASILSCPCRPKATEDSFPINCNTSLIAVPGLLWVLLAIRLHGLVVSVPTFVAICAPSGAVAFAPPRLQARARQQQGTLPNHSPSHSCYVFHYPGPGGFAGAPRDIEARASTRGRRCDTLYIPPRALDSSLIARQAPTYTSYASRDLSMCPSSPLRVLHCTAPS